MLFRPRCRVASVAALTGLLLAASASRAELFTGTLYYTNNTGGNNVDKVAFSYDDQTHSLSLGAHVVVANVNGADGIMFAPNGNLVVTSNSTDAVYRIDAGSGALLQTVTTSNPSDFHMALDPSGTKFYSSDSYGGRSFGQGNLDTFVINSNGTFNNAVASPISGSVDHNVTQLAFAPNGKILYTDGEPNSNGAIGLYDLSTNTTTDLYPHNSVTAAHGVIYDPFTGLWTMFGGGAVATMDPNAGSNALIAASLRQRNGINSDFDQGAVDGFGHALIAGNGQLTFIDYSQTHDITNPNNIVIIRGGFSSIDDVAPLVGPGSNTSTPEPSGITLLGLGAAGLFLGWTRRRANR